MADLSKLETMMSLEFSDCSIAAAELNTQVRDLLGHSALAQAREFYVLGGSGTPPSRSVSSVTLVGEFQTTPGGREASLVVMEGADASSPAYLAAVTRQNVALPLASFARRTGPSCDFVQIGTEIDEGSLVVTPDDEIPRAKVIDLLQDFAEDRRHEVISDKERLLLEAKGARTRREIADDVMRLTSREVVGRERETEFTEEGAYLIGLLQASAPRNKDGYSYKEAEEVSHDFPYLGDNGSRTIRKARSKGWSDGSDTTYGSSEMDALLDKFPEPGLAREIILDAFRTRHAKAVASYQPPATRHGRKARELASLLDIEAHLETYVGDYDPHEERLIELSDHLGTGSYSISETTQLGRKPRETALLIDVTTTGPTNTVDIKARPAAQEEVRPLDVYRVDANRCAELTIDSSDAEVVSYLLGKAVADKDDRNKLAMPKKRWRR